MIHLGVITQGAARYDGVEKRSAEGGFLKCVTCYAGLIKPDIEEQNRDRFFKGCEYTKGM